MAIRRLSFAVDVLVFDLWVTKTGLLIYFKRFKTIKIQTRSFVTSEQVELNQTRLALGCLTQNRKTYFEAGLSGASPRQPSGGENGAGSRTPRCRGHSIFKMLKWRKNKSWRDRTAVEHRRLQRSGIDRGTGTWIKHTLKIWINWNMSEWNLGLKQLSYFWSCFWTSKDRLETFKNWREEKSVIQRWNINYFMTKVCKLSRS